MSRKSSLLKKVAKNATGFTKSSIRATTDLVKFTLGLKQTRGRKPGSKNK